MEFLHPVSTHALQDSAEHRSIQRGGWVKRTPEDLSQALANFAALDAQLTHQHCALVQQMLRDVNFTIFAWRHGQQSESVQACRDHLFPAAA
jgi:hypothetical protein